MPDRSETISERLKEARRAMDFPSAKAAAETDGFPVPRDTLIGWESRGTEPGVSRLSEVCEFYGVTLAWVTGEADHPSGLPVAEAIVDMDAVRRVEDAESLSDIKDLLKPCRFCSRPRIPIAFEFPSNHDAKSTIEIVDLSEAVNRKLDVLLALEQSEEG